MQKEPRDLKKLLLYTLKLIKSFIVELFDPKLSFYAASMSWATLFFLIPMLVITLSVIIYTPLFSQFYAKVHALITASLLPTSSQQLIAMLDKFVANSYQMGYIGGVYVLVAAIFFFRDFDYIVNDIFDNKRRHLSKVLVIYGLMLILIPLSTAASIWLFTLIDSSLHLAPIVLQFFITWLIVFAVYKIAPKEFIPLNVAAMSSFIATLIWHIAKSIFLFYILYNKTYTTIYGTVAVILFTFLWIYISWLIFLHGLQLCKIMLDEE